MAKRLVVIVVGAIVMMPCLAAVICTADSPATFIDSRSGVRYEATTNVVHTLNYDSSWVGEDASAEVAIAVDGEELFRGTGVGECAWTNKTYGAHTLTYTTYISGVAQDEVYSTTITALDVTGLGLPGLQRVTFTGNAYDTSYARAGSEPIVTLDGEGMYDNTIGTKTTYAYTGYMYFRAGEEYTFRAYFDDFSWVTVDGQTVVARNAGECKEGTGSITFAEAGWRAVDFRVANNGSAGGLASGASYQGIWYQTDLDTTWRQIADDGSGTLLRTGADYCSVEIISARMRPSDPTILDIVYKVTSPKETVKVRALAYEDGKRSFATAVPALTFADGTEVNVGDSVAANEEKTLSWQVAADWATDLSKVRIEIMVVEDELLPLHFVSIPATTSHAALQYSDTTLTSSAVLNALLWLYASQDEELSLTNGQLKNSAGLLLADGTTIKNEAQTVAWLFSRMGYSVLSGDDLSYVNAVMRTSLSPSGLRQFAVKTVAP